jgi:hypothetical protein
VELTPEGEIGQRVWVAAEPHRARLGKGFGLQPTPRSGGAGTSQAVLAACLEAPLCCGRNNSKVDSSSADAERGGWTLYYDREVSLLQSSFFKGGDRSVNVV